MSVFINDKEETKDIEISSLDAEEIFNEAFGSEDLEKVVEVPYEVKDEVKITKKALTKYKKVENLTTKEGRKKVSKTGRIISINDNGILQVDFWNSRPARIPVHVDDVEIVSRFKDRENVAAANVPIKEVISPIKGVGKTEADAKPSRYNQGSIEVWDAIEGMNLGYLEGNVVKYVARYKHKNGKEDLLKALNYLIKIIANNSHVDYYTLRNTNVEFLESILFQED